MLPQGGAGHLRPAVNSERDFVGHLAAERGIRHRRICLWRLAAAFEGWRRDSANPIIAVLETANAQLDHRVVVRLHSLHSSALGDKAVHRTTAGDPRRVEHEQLAGLDALQGQQELKLPRTSGLARKPLLPMALAVIAPRLAVRRHEALEEVPLLAPGRVALSHQLDPSPLTLVVDHDELRSLWDFFAVARLPKFAGLGKLEKRSVHSRAVRSKVSRHGRAAICKRRLSRWDDDALLFTLLFEF